MDPFFRNVLIVDDDPVVHRYLTALLKANGYQPTCFSDGELALESLESDHYDFVISDWVMPKMDGVTLCREIRQLQLPGYIYIILLTCMSQTSDIVLGLNAGADDFVNKPCNPDVLLARLLSGARVLQLERRLRAMAREDVLTGLMNRATLMQEIEREWSRATRHDCPLSCVMVDIDHFKSVNDTFGHLAGDMVLKSVASVLKAQMRRSDSIGRYGGEEFCLILPETEYEGALMVAERCREAIAGTDFKADRVPVNITSSFGVAVKSHQMAGFEHLIDVADQALLNAKRNGRNQVVVAESRQLQESARG
jgi:two-component system chemotaxis response regulator CheY